MRNYLIAAVVAALIALAWLADRQGLEGELVQKDLDHAAELSKRDAAVIQGQTKVLEQYGALVAGLSQIDAKASGLAVTLKTQGAERRAEYLELLSNDPVVSSWESSPLPAAVGLRYARPATTDPAEWRAARRGVPAGGVPAAGSGGGGQ